MSFNLFNIKLKKKGFTYILVSSLLVVVLIGIFFAAKKYTYQDQTELYAIKIRAMNDFVKNFNNDVHRATHVSAFRAMIALEDRVASTGTYLASVNTSFKETFYNGTIEGQPVEIMTDSAFKDYMNKIQLLADDVGIRMNATVDDIVLTQTTPWVINVRVYITMNISDSQNKISWIKHENFDTDIPIENLRDPLYGVNTLNKLPNTIRQCNTTDLVKPNNDTSGLMICVNDSSYLHSEFAPSFLMRFEGNTGADVNGIESIVHIQTLSDQELTVYTNRVKVDYLYFENIPTTNLCFSESDIPDTYFIIPNNRVTLYQLGGLIPIACP